MRDENLLTWKAHKPLICIHRCRSTRSITARNICIKCNFTFNQFKCICAALDGTSIKWISSNKLKSSRLMQQQQHRLRRWRAPNEKKRRELLRVRRRRTNVLHGHDNATHPIGIDGAMPFLIRFYFGPCFCSKHFRRSATERWAKYATSSHCHG